MNLLTVTTHLPPAQGWGGVLTANANRNRGFKAYGWNVHVLATDGCRKRGRVDAATIGRTAQNLQVTVCRHLFFARYGFAPGVVAKILVSLRQADFVFIGGIATWPVTVAALLCALLRKPYAVAVHGGLVEEHVREIRETKPHKWIFYKLLTLPTLRQAAFVNVASTFEASGVRQLLPDVEVVITPNALDLSEFTATEVLPALDGMRVIYVGRISPEKGVLALVKAWAAVAGPKDRLEIVGSGNGRYAREVMQMISADPRIQISGELRQAEVLERITQSHGLVLPSGLDGALKENFGNVVAEAMALGRPVLVPAGLAWDAVEGEGAGFLFEPTSEGLSNALARFASLTDQQRRAAGRCARRFAEQNLDIVSSTAELVRVISDRRSLRGGRRP